MAMLIGVLVYATVLILNQGIDEDEIKILPGSRKLLGFYQRINTLIPGRRKRRVRRPKEKHKKVQE
jgi:hypothetical protein